MNKLDRITKENQQLFKRLQSVRSDYDATKILKETSAQQVHKKRLTNYQNGKEKRDPLADRLRLSTLNSNSRRTISKAGMDSLDSARDDTAAARADASNSKLA